jgi:hypothetical protein
MDADNRDEIYIGIEITGTARFFNGTVQRFNGSRHSKVRRRGGSVIFEEAAGTTAN